MAKKSTTVLNKIKNELIGQLRKSNSLYDKIALEKDFLEKLGLDVSKKTIKVENLQLKKGLLFSDSFSVSLIDARKDIDGLELKDHPLLTKLIQQKFSRGETDLALEEVWDKKIILDSKGFNLGNISVKMPVMGSGFKLGLIDKDKDCFGKWIDSAIDKKKVVKVLNDFELKKSKLKSMKETTLNSELEKHFRLYFDNCSKSAGNQKGLFDLVLGDVKKDHFVIEMKMASSAKKTDQRDRAHGQMDRYLKEMKSKNFMLLIAGIADDQQDANIKSLKKSAEKEFGVSYYFLEAQ